MATEPLHQIRQIIDGCSETQRIEIVKLLRAEYRTHPIEQRWNTSAEVILEALARSSELTQRMFKEILAEAAFKVEVMDKLAGWQDVTPPGSHAYDFLLKHGDEQVSVQVKLQRKEAGKSLMYRLPGKPRAASRYYVVETQKSRKGSHRKSGASTRPYRFGEFDILAVSMEPVTADWSQFRFTVARWLIPRPEDHTLVAVYQPVSLEPNDDWTDSLLVAIQWWRSKQIRTLSVPIASEGSP